MPTPFSHAVVDGVEIDLSAGVSATQNTLIHDGTKFVPSNDLGTIEWDNTVEGANTTAAYPYNFSIGVEFVVTSFNSTIIGAKFVFPENVSRTIRFRVWNDAGVAQIIGAASATYYDQTFSVAGVYTVTFPVGVAVVTPPKIFRLSMWETSGTKYYEAVAATIRPVHNLFCQSGPNFAWTFAALYSSVNGDNYVNISEVATIVAPITPRITVP